MRLYPDLPGDRARAIAIDVAMLLLLYGCLSVALFVHAAVSQLDVLGRGLQRAGTQVEDSLAAAGDAVERTPLVGDDLDRALTQAGRRTGAPVITAGARGREAVSDLATLLAFVTGGLPALALLAPYVPWRIRRARRLLAARRVFDDAASPERRRLLAMRAAFSLPLDTLLQHTDDPLGDLEAGWLDPLIAALGDEYGLRAPRHG